jgi:3-methyladenine DNA glycosylase AlkD
MNRIPPTIEELLGILRGIATPETLTSQSRFGIVGKQMLGASLYDVRKVAKGIRNHDLALGLWATGIHEARMLASMIDEPLMVTLEQLETWVADFDSWDICDITTDELFIHTAHALEVIPRWAIRQEEYVKRAAFAMVAALTIHRKDLPDEILRPYFNLIENAAGDDRNFVKKAVNWALRNIGKFRPGLRAEAVACAHRLLLHESKSARWIAKDAIREFTLKFGDLNETNN